jgi:hypothetical protein
MRKISLIAGVAGLILIGVGAWISVRAWTSTTALADSTLHPLEMMMSLRDLPTSFGPSAPAAWRCSPRSWHRAPKVAC